MKRRTFIQAAVGVVLAIPAISNIPQVKQTMISGFQQYNPTSKGKPLGPVQFYESNFKPRA